MKCPKKKYDCYNCNLRFIIVNKVKVYCNAFSDMVSQEVNKDYPKHKIRKENNDAQ